MNIAIFGATGIVGKAIVKEALQKGHCVTVLTRHAENISLSNANLKVVEGNVTDRATVDRVLTGQDAVILARARFCTGAYLKPRRTTCAGHTRCVPSRPYRTATR